jgi:hypothetical protein
MSLVGLKRPEIAAGFEKYRYYVDSIIRHRRRQGHLERPLRITGTPKTGGVDRSQIASIAEQNEMAQVSPGFYVGDYTM